MKKARNSPVCFRSPAGIPLPVRLVFMGDHRSGVTSLPRRFCQGLFRAEYRSEVAKLTIYKKNMFHARRGYHTMVEVCDVEGADTTTASQCALRAHSCAVVYDVTNRDSFENAQTYFNFVNPMVMSLLIGNKIDLKNTRRVSYEEGRLLAKIQRVKFIETSAKLNYNVEEAFQIMLMSVPDEYFVKLSGEKTVATKTHGRSVCTFCRRRKPQLGSTGSSTSSVDDLVGTTDEEDSHRHRPHHACHCCESPASQRP